jgi:hypothetical protein
MLPTNKLKLLACQNYRAMEDFFDALPEPCIYYGPALGNGVLGNLARRDDWVFCDPCQLIRNQREWDLVFAAFAGRTRRPRPFQVLLSRNGNTMNLFIQPTGEDGLYCGCPIDTAMLALCKYSERQWVFPDAFLSAPRSSRGGMSPSTLSGLWRGVK